MRLHRKLEHRLGKPIWWREHLSLAHYYWAVAHRALSGYPLDIRLMQERLTEIPKPIAYWYQLARDGR